MTLGTPMNSMSSCDTLHTNSALWTRITELNDTLIQISDDMYHSIQSLSTKDKSVERKITHASEDLRHRIQDLNKNRNKLLSMKEKVDTLEGDFQNSTLQVNREYAHYLVWALGVATLGVITYRALN